MVRKTYLSIHSDVQMLLGRISIIAILLLNVHNSVEAKATTTAKCRPLQRPASSLRDWEKSLFHIINRYRQQKGLRPLRYNEKLAQIAREHGREMASRESGAHHKHVQQRYRKMGQITPWVAAGENVAYNYRYQNPVQKAFEQWKGSRGHKKLMLKSWSKYHDSSYHGQSGIGIAQSPEGRYYFTQLFLEERSKSPQDHTKKKKRRHRSFLKWFWR
jgi:uncharacterized protein YkwD